MNSGKKFEALIKDSCKIQGIDCTRLKDAGWQGEETQRRFTSKNICDFILFDGSILLFAEAKSRKSIVRFDELTQQEELIKKQESTDIDTLHCGYFLQFNGDGYTWYLDCGLLDELKSVTGKKSFNNKDLESFSTEHPLFCKYLHHWVPERKRKFRLDIAKVMSKL